MTKLSSTCQSMFRWVESNLIISSAILTVVCFVLSAGNLHATWSCCGKADFDPIFAHVDVLEHGKTIHKMNLGGLRADTHVQVWNGVCLKPWVMAAWGDGEVYTVGVGLGHCLPITKCFIITPIIGYSYSHLKTCVDIHYDAPFIGEIVFKNLKETFQSNSPYAALEFAYLINDVWRVCGAFQWAWCRTKTNIHTLVKNKKSNSQGPIYGIQLERDINKCWAAHIAYGYNSSLTKEKHGFRGYAIKAGIGRWF